MKAILSLCLAAGVVLADNSTSSSGDATTTTAPRTGAPTTLAPAPVTTTTTTPTTPPAPVMYCPAGWCRDVQWFPGSPCITPDPTVLGPCWDSYCKANVVFPTSVPTGSIIIDPGQDKGSYCKSWQIPAGRVCYGNDTVSCECDSFNSTMPVTTLPGTEPTGWSPAINCTYPTPTTTTTTLSPTWNPYDPNDPNNNNGDNDGNRTPPVVPPANDAFSLVGNSNTLLTTVLATISILAILLQ